MTEPALVVLAAGLATRYGRVKVLEPVARGSSDCLLDLSLRSAAAVGIERAIVVTREELRADLTPRLERAPLACRLVVQRLDDLPDAVAAPPDRQRPWGTGHALLAARRELEGPFAVANADDLYGPEAWQGLAKALELCGTGHGLGLLVSFPADATLSQQGGVSRGWVRECSDGSDRSEGRDSGDRGDGGRGDAHEARPVDRIIELRDLQWDAGVQKRRLVGLDPDGTLHTIAAHTPVSMNLWALPHEVIPALWRDFGSFLAELPAEPAPSAPSASQASSAPSAASASSAEFALSTALDALVQRGELSLRHLPRGRRWAGLTHPGDEQRVRSAVHRWFTSDAGSPRQ